MKKKIIFGAACSLGLMSASALAQAHHHLAVQATSTAASGAVASSIAYNQTYGEQPHGLDGLGTPAVPAKASPANLHPLLDAAGVSIFAPPGFGADQNTLFAGVMGVNRFPGGALADGSVSAGFGFGNGDKSVGASISVLNATQGFYGRPFGSDGDISGQVFRWLTASTSVSVGAASITGWGAFHKAAQSYYGSVTQLVPVIKTSNVMIPLALTVGVGTGAFVSSKAFLSGNDSKTDMYGSAALGIFKRVNLIVDYTTGMLSSGVSMVPFIRLPAAVTFYATNLAGNQWVRGPVTYGMQLSFSHRFA